MTNFERINRMSVEEMAQAIKNSVNDNLLCDCCIYTDKKCKSYCTNGIKQWSESEEE